jgi:hypothetical protein
MYLAAASQISKGTFETHKQAILQARAQERAQQAQLRESMPALVRASQHTGHIPAGISNLALFKTATAMSNLPLHLRSIATGLNSNERQRDMYGRYQELGCSSSMLIIANGELNLVVGTLIAAKGIAEAASAKKRKAPVALCPLPVAESKKRKAPIALCPLTTAPAMPKEEENALQRYMLPSTTSSGSSSSSSSGAGNSRKKAPKKAKVKGESEAQKRKAILMSAFVLYEGDPQRIPFGVLAQLEATTEKNRDQIFQYFANQRKRKKLRKK